MHPDMEKIHCVIMRGGTSKGVFIMGNELPENDLLRDKVIKAIFGSPDIRQIDGLGGADTLTSKLAIISKPSREDVDVDYTFAQVGIDQDIVDYSGNCGNISSAVGPYAIDEGIVEAAEPVTKVRIFQRNTGKILIAEVPVRDGKALATGDYHIDGVPGTGAKITMDFSDTVGSITGSLLPTGNPKDIISLPEKDYLVSIVDAAIPVVFINAESLNLSGVETPAQIEKDRELMSTIESIRGKAAQMIGIVKNWKDSAKQSPYTPFFAIISKPHSYFEINGVQVKEEQVHLVSRLLFMLKMHKAYPGTGGVCTGAAVRIKDSVAWEVLSNEGHSSNIISIGHPSGVMKVESIVKNGNNKNISFDKLAFYRTARRIMDGYVYFKKSVLQC